MKFITMLLFILTIKNDHLISKIGIIGAVILLMRIITLMGVIMENPYKKPTPPADGICCESACNPCVWDNYYADLKKWRIAEAKLREQQEKREKLEKKTP